jgi:hypothetical protein
MEYYFETSLGLIAIVPLENLPSAVELRVAGTLCDTYLSAEDAADAVASSSTGHMQLDALPSSRVPLLLSDWKQSVPHRFGTAQSSSGAPQEPARDCLSSEQQLVY